MIERQRRIVEIGQRQIAREPFQIGEGRPIDQPVPRGQIVGRLRIALAHLRARQIAPPAGPPARLAQTLIRAALAQNHRDRLIAVVAFQVAVEQGMSHQRIGLQGLRHIVGGDLAVFDLLAGFGHLAPGLADQRQHLVHVAQPAPECHVEPCIVVRRQEVPVARDELIVFGGGQVHGQPGQRQCRLGLAGPACGQKGAGMGQRACAGLRQVPVEKGQNLRIGPDRRHPLFALAAQVVETGPVGMRVQKRRDLARCALPVAEAIPLDQRRCRRAVTFGQAHGDVPSPALHCIKRRRQRTRRNARRFGR